MESDGERASRRRLVHAPRRHAAGAAQLRAIRRPPSDPPCGVDRGPTAAGDSTNFERPVRPSSIFPGPELLSLDSQRCGEHIPPWWPRFTWCRSASINLRVSGTGPGPQEVQNRAWLAMTGRSSAVCTHMWCPHTHYRRVAIKFARAGTISPVPGSGWASKGPVWTSTLSARPGRPESLTGILSP